MFWFVVILVVFILMKLLIETFKVCIYIFYLRWFFLVNTTNKSYIFTACKRSCGKVMFSQACIIHSVHGMGGLGVSQHGSLVT